MLNPVQFKDYVIDPTLKEAGLYSPESSDLLLGTALVESNLTDLIQSNGPALGLFQIEPSTFKDIFDRYLLRKDKERLADAVMAALSAGPWKSCPPEEYQLYLHTQLQGNLPFAVLIARVRYLMVPEAIPTTPDQQAIYWQTHYNTNNRDADIVRYLRRWREYESQVGV